MNHIRDFARASSGLHRLLLTFATALVLIAGLLAMHSLSGSFTGGHSDAPATASEPAVADPAMGAGAGAAGVFEMITAGGSGAGHCAGDCGGASGAPDDSMLMVCVLALLAAAVVLLTPALVSRLSAARALLRLQRRNILAALPHPRPPSLIVLSISRT